MRKMLVAAVAACAGLAWAKTSTPDGWTDDFEYQEFWIIRNLKTLRMATFPHPQCLRA